VTEAATPRWPFAALVAATGLATVGALVAGAGHPLVAAAPVLAAGAVWAVTRLPLRQSLAALLLAVLVIDKPAGAAHGGRVALAALPVGSLLFENLSKHTGIDALRFALIDLVLLGLVALALLRGPGEPAGGERPPKVLTASLVLALAGLGLSMAWGAARGGDLKGALWQVRQLVAFPVLGLLFLSAFREPRHFLAWGRSSSGPPPSARSRGATSASHLPPAQLQAALRHHALRHPALRVGHPAAGDLLARGAHARSFWAMVWAACGSCWACT
jgi:hypothetical protein